MPAYKPSYAEKALRDVVWSLGRVDDMQLVDQLRDGAYRLGQLIASGLLDAEEVSDALGARALAIDDTLTSPEAFSLIYAAFDAAKAAPAKMNSPCQDGMRLHSFAEFSGHEPAERGWIVENWVPRGATTVLFGDGGTGKSLLCQQLATSVAAGVPFLGLPVTPGEVLAVYCEDDADELHRRQRKINAVLGIDFGDLAASRFISAVGDDATLFRFSKAQEGQPTEFANRLAGMAEGANLIIVDTAADTFAGNEVDRYQVRQFMTWLNRLARDNGAAVILLAHPSLTGMSSNRGQSGSMAWTNSARSHLYLQNRDDDSDSDGGVDHEERLLSRKKSNYAAKGEALALRLEDGVFRLGTPKGKAGKPKSARLTDNQRICLTALSRAIDAAGEVANGDPDPDGAVKAVRIVRVALWREYSQNHGLGVEGSDGADDAKKRDDRFRRAFADCVKALQAKGLVRVREDAVWMP